ncbi:uncharacterized protein RSE6_03957 [Rhynchosporium secalis]|uniref:Uncharacterized protein n=1 Tax=Rhynchosporium secalis TaxID=38038 RepID=A0A1E1M421_RHYSE|nr:uncharacterized protein RSE6_03957 [Rhynchosporium secalis]
MGVFSKFAAALTSIPASVLGGMTPFLFSSVAVSGMRLVSTVPFTRHTRFILTAAWLLGMVLSWCRIRFLLCLPMREITRRRKVLSLSLIMETGFALTAFIALDLNLNLPDENSDEETESLAGDEPRSEDGEPRPSQHRTHARTPSKLKRGGGVMDLRTVHTSGPTHGPTNQWAICGGNPEISEGRK